jgi:integrase
MHSYQNHVRAHLGPHFGDRDIRSIHVASVQAFYGVCFDRGRPRSPRTIEMIIANLRLILSHARSSGIIENHAVQTWKRDRVRRRRSSLQTVTSGMVLSAEELERLLDAAQAEHSDYFPLFLFLADLGVRLRKAVALRRVDANLDEWHAQIARSLSDFAMLKMSRRTYAHSQPHLRSS